MSSSAADPPAELVCPITLEIFSDPVIAPDGVTYERSAITKWLATHDCAPTTRQIMTVSQLVPNRSVRDAAERWRADHGLAVPAVKPSAAEPAASAPAEPLQLQFGATTADGFTPVSVVPPSAGPRPPVHICCIIDVSGSMQRSASKRNADNKLEEYPFDLLDIVIHATKTVAHLLGEHDYLSVVDFSDSASVVLTPTKMSEAGRASALDALGKMNTRGCTNLGDGLRCGLDLLHKTMLSSVKAVPYAFMLTDGEPNEGSAADEVMKSMRRMHAATTPLVTVQTFGFGYGAISSALMSRVAHIGGGSYCYVPDAGFVGTAFVNAISEALATCAVATKLILPLGTEALGHRVDENGVILLGAVSYGQPRHVLLRLPKADPAAVKLAYAGAIGLTHAEVSAVPSTAEWDLDKSLFVRHASRLVAVLGKIMNAEDSIKAAPDDCSTGVASLVAELKAAVDAHPECGRVKALLNDSEKQIALGLTDEHFTRWGLHYSIALRDALLREKNANFKDASLQHFGGKQFHESREAGNDVFNLLPAPSGRSGSGSHHTGVAVAMASLNNESDPCVAGTCRVQLAPIDGRVMSKPMSQLRVGDRVATPSGCAATVERILETITADGTASLVSLPGGCLVTPYHPVWVAPDAVEELSPAGLPAHVSEADARQRGFWLAPGTSGHPTRKLPCAQLFSVVLEGAEELAVPAIIVEGTPVISWAHGIRNDPVASHPLFGERAALMRALPDGGVRHHRLASGALLRDPETSLACGFDQTKFL